MTDAPMIALAAIRAVEQRDVPELIALYDPNVEFDWPPDFPYSGHHQGAQVAEMSARFASVWGPLQPTAFERSMDAEVIATTGDEVVVRYAWRALDAQSRRFETPVLAHYRVVNGKLRSARMFYWDHLGLVEFVRRSGVLNPSHASTPTTSDSVAECPDVEDRK
jgi:ketosteroid isomerase-like protein